MAKATVMTLDSPKVKSGKRSMKSLFATCAADGAGWCPYPFSMKQLERRLKEKALAEQPEPRESKQKRRAES